MRRSALAFSVSLLLAGCASEPKIVTEHVQIEVPERYLQCEGVKKSEIPSWQTLTDAQVANLVRKYDVRLRKCEANMSAVRRYIELSKENTAAPSKENLF